jgi:hypothetical protein
MELKETKSKGEDIATRSADIYRGIAFNRYRIPEILQAIKVESRDVYSLTNRAPALGAENNFKIDKIPSIINAHRKQYILMFDFPLNKGMLPDLAIEKLVRDVKAGSHLFIFGGLVTLNKGQFQGTAIDEVLPVNVDNPWAIKKMQMSNLYPGAALRYMHDLSIKPDVAQTIRKTSTGEPICVTRKIEKGKVSVFLGMPSGTSEDSDQTMFWESPSWPEYAAKLINGEK